MSESINVKWTASSDTSSLSTCFLSCFQPPVALTLPTPLLLHSNSTFLTVERGPFMALFGDYFQGRLKQAHDFFMDKVEM